MIVAPRYLSNLGLADVEEEGSEWYVPDSDSELGKGNYHNGFVIVTRLDQGHGANFLRAGMFAILLWESYLPMDNDGARI